MKDRLGREKLKREPEPGVVSTQILASVPLHDSPSNGQTQASPLFHPGRRCAQLMEFLKDNVLLFGRNADAVVRQSNGDA